ncbi:MAG TPA: hypothetical protein VFN43_02075 [Humibacillus sp.]|nr:hypothetical protein [Humibacillus sp.]
MSTHVLPTDLRAWVLGDADGVVSMSVEQHVVRCVRCQSAVADEVAAVTAAEEPAHPHTTAPDLNLVWNAVRDQVELPPVSRLERLLAHLGLPPGDAMLVAAAPALRGSWICAVALAVAFAVGGAVSARTGSAGAFLMLAPLVPVVGVAVAFGPEAGPALEQESSAPYPLVRLILLRSSAVLLAALPVVVVGQLVFPQHLAWLWLLPALGFTAAVLGLSSWFGPWRPAVAIVLLWVVATAAAARVATVGALLAPRFLVLYTVLLLAGPVVLVVRARRLGTIGRISS